MKRLLTETSAYKILYNDAAKNTLAHTYMLCFADSRNMRLALKELAKVILGGGDRVERLVENEAYSDCKIYPEEGKKLTVDIASEIVGECAIKPIEGDKKLFILIGMEEASPAVQNKLLKALEEPPEGVIFLLGATNEYSVLPTVRSRARILSVPPFTEEQVAKTLKRNYPDLSESEIAEYAGASGGIVGEAFNMIDGGYFSSLMELALQFVSAEEGNFSSITLKATDIKQKKEFITLLKTVYRDMLMYKSGARCALLKREEPRIRAAAENYTAHKIVYAIERLTSAERDIKFNANYTMLILDMLINISSAK